ncbi:hypothetical protein QBC33DRAFT_580912 [Phialemonium atrogriseum]|uniref:Aminoglycoside phosphotransferase domain-containing protein n=1 Tax=Phialemonium atrogriseum TaxID=1093897 RepID=A0AAJ0BT02_9PEZI|nr:uncharacterized protein QBC33DRAFT_580912 [Phialemonium atrogriseum]KAK1763750.1 hypothetical protein QBC33DRAFT_580912 [Phialemonium atrogriseum]
MPKLGGRTGSDVVEATFIADPLFLAIILQGGLKQAAITYPDAAHGKEIYNFFGNRVLEHTTLTGAILAIKVKPPTALDRSEADMMQYAATNHVLAPNVRGVYDIVTTKPIARVLVSEGKSGLKDQLRAQPARMRACTQPFIGRVGRQHVRNRVLERERRDSPGAFVLTHGDLTPRNFLVQGGVITGIVDWERSGFFPEYAEYAFAMALCHGHEKWWVPVLKDVLQPCSEQRLEFTCLVEKRGF